MKPSRFATLWCSNRVSSLYFRRLCDEPGLLCWERHCLRHLRDLCRLLLEKWCRVLFRSPLIGVSGGLLPAAMQGCEILFLCHLILWRRSEVVLHRNIRYVEGKSSRGRVRRTLPGHIPDVGRALFVHSNNSGIVIIKFALLSLIVHFLAQSPANIRTKF